MVFISTEKNLRCKDVVCLQNFLYKSKDKDHDKDKRHNKARAHDNGSGDDPADPRLCGLFFFARKVDGDLSDQVPDRHRSIVTHLSSY